jgi:hypothetical protein
MLTLEIKDKQLLTDKNFSAQIEDQSPATKFDEIVGSKAIGIELPINDTNMNILQNPERFEKMGNVNDRRFTGTALKHFGQIIQKGTLVIDGAHKTYSGWLRDIVGNLAERVAGKFINQTTLGGAKTFVNKTTYDPATDDYACPKVYNRAFWRDKGKRSDRTMVVTDLEGNEYNTEEEDGELTWQFFENGSFLVNYPGVGGVVAGGTDNAPVVSPMLFLWRAIELILSDNYIFVKENFLKDDTALKKLILYNTFNIVNVDVTTETKILYYQHPYLPYVIFGEETEEEVIVATSYATGAFKYENLLPKISIGKLILSTQNLVNVIFSFNDLDECRIVDRQKLLTEPAYDIDEYMIGEWELGERKDVTVKLSQEHDPQDAYFKDQWQDLSDLRQNISEPVQQRTDLDALTPEMDEIRLVESENRYYQYHWYVISQPGDNGTEEEEDVLGWEMISIAFQPYFYNDGDKEVEEIKTEFSTVQQSDNGYPIVYQKGNTKAFHSQHESFTPRLLFYEGADAASYHTSTLSLDYDGELGLAKKRWNYWLPFWANRLPAQAIFKFPASVFYYIKNNKAILPLRTRHGSFIIDRMEAIASKADLIETRLYVFKRESVVGYEEGTVPGDGGIPPVTFTPVYVGVTSTGKPYLVNALGDVRITPAWGTLSPAPFAKSVCVDYDPVNKLLFVGGYSGKLHITDLSDIDNIRMKTIYVFSGGNVSAVRYLNGRILVGKDAGNLVYVQPHYEDLSMYGNSQATGGTLNKGYTAKDFLWYNNYYYSCSKAGEVHRTTTPTGTWTELADWKADFRKMVETDNKLMTFGKDDNHSDDRAFSAQKSNPASWSEFDVESTRAIYVSDAVAYGTNQALIVTNKEYGGLKIVNSNNSTTSFTPPLAKTCAGVCVIDNAAVVAIQEGNLATKIAIGPPVPGIWSYVNVPALFWKLFGY